MKTPFLRANLVLSMMIVLLCCSVKAEAYQYVKLEGRQLVADFDEDGRYEPFFVKGVGYAPVPIGQFIGVDGAWLSVCAYAGQFPLEYPELRFRHDSPDGTYNHYTDPLVFGGSMPDGVENPEWWGVMSVEQNPDSGEIDQVHPRLVYDELQREFAPLSITNKTKAGRRRKAVFKAMVTDEGAGVNKIDLETRYPGGQWETRLMRYKRRKNIYVYKKKFPEGTTPVTLQYRFAATDNTGNREVTEIFTLNVR